MTRTYPDDFPFSIAYGRKRRPSRTIATPTTPRTSPRCITRDYSLLLRRNRPVKALHENSLETAARPAAAHRDGRRTEGKFLSLVLHAGDDLTN